MIVDYALGYATGAFTVLVLTWLTIKRKLHSVIS